MHIFRAPGLDVHTDDQARLQHAADLMIRTAKIKSITARVQALSETDKYYPKLCSNHQNNDKEVRTFLRLHGLGRNIVWD
jgi:hypothetical protein